MEVNMKEQCKNKKCWANSRFHINGCIVKEEIWAHCDGEKMPQAKVEETTTIIEEAH